MNLASQRYRLLMAPAERADLLVDFTNVPPGNYALKNAGPDEPFEDDPDFEPARRSLNRTGDAVSCGSATESDPTTPPEDLRLPEVQGLPAATLTRPLALIEEMSSFFEDAPAEALLGIVSGDPNSGAGMWIKKAWMDSVSENPTVGATEVWELYNATGDAHPIHVHEVKFQVVNRQEISVNDETRIVRSSPTQ